MNENTVLTLGLVSQFFAVAVASWHISRYIAEYEGKISQIRHELKQDISSLGDMLRDQLQFCGYQDKDILRVLSHLQKFLERKFEDFHGIEIHGWKE